MDTKSLGQFCSNRPGLGGSCRVHKPEVPRGPASTPGLGPRKQHVVHGLAQRSKNTTGRKDSPVADREVCPKERTPAHQLLRPTSDQSARIEHQPPLGGLSDRKAWPKTLLPTPTSRFRPGTHSKACVPLFSDWRSQGRLEPSDRGRPLGRDQGRTEKASHKVKP